MSRVLLATPDRFLRDQYEAALQDAGFAVEAAGDGVQCLAAIRTAAPALIILDTDILWGGAEGVLAVLAEERSPEVPCIVISSRRSRLTLYHVAGFLVGDYHVKPLSGTELVCRARALLQREAAPLDSVSRHTRCRR